jgi:hypothetical protein
MKTVSEDSAGKNVSRYFGARLTAHFGNSLCPGVLVRKNILN